MVKTTNFVSGRWRCTLIIASLFCGQMAGAEAALVEEAFERMAARPDAPWSFLQTTTEKNDVTVERCDHDGDMCAWTLVSVKGKTPTRKRLARYAEKKAEEAEQERAAKAESKKEQNRFATLAEPESIRLLEENAQRAVYRFTPLSENEDEKKINEQLHGKLVINKLGPYVESFELKNREPIAPAPLVKIHKMHVEMNFAPVAEGGPYLPQSMRTDIAGKIGGLKKIGEQRAITFSDYQY